MALNDRQQALKIRFTSEKGTWSDAWESILKLNPDYFEAYLKLREAPLKKQALSPKVQQLILVALEAGCTTLFEPGIKDHIEGALAAGATRAEIFEVLELASVLGVHAVSVGVPLLLEVLKEEGQEESSPPLDERRENLKADFTAKRGYWADNWDAVLNISPDFFEAYTEFSSVPFANNGGLLEPKVKELVYCAIDCATTHLFGPGLKIHIRNAVRYGATKGEIMEVFELAALMGIHTPMVASRYLLEK